MANLRDKMVTFSNKRADITAIEGWETRFGKSVRVVKRDGGGRFISNVSAKQLSKTL